MTNLTQIQFEMNLVKENDSFLWRSVLNGVVFILCIWINRFEIVIFAVALCTGKHKF